MNKNKFLAVCILSSVLITAPAAYADAEDYFTDYLPNKFPNKSKSLKILLISVMNIIFL